ncbi:hypothetical protein OG512_00760 [Streptomyces sp. NBC_01378]|uniref:Uncharacterized protein n=1 Tax=Streptomyces sp. NBC_00119 TaxID=2975659 RepID=A0AAU1UM54_9ACTN
MGGEVVGERGEFGGVTCLRKADAAARLCTGPDLNTALVPRIADIVCGSAGRPCGDCWDKATTLVLELRR